MRLVLPALLCVVSLAAGPPTGDLEKIQGAWIVSRTEINGKPQPNNPHFTVKVTFEGDRINASVGMGQPTPRGTVKLDHGQNPKAYDLTTPEGTLVRGIYHLDGDTLKVCLSEPGGERPSALATNPDDGRTLLVYRREKPSRGH